MNTVLCRSITATVAVAAMMAPLALAGPASAKGRGDNAVRTTGQCAGGGNFELKAKHDDGRIEVEYEVDTGRAGQTWAVRLTDNGVAVYSGRALTVAPSGSFTVRREIADRVGADIIRAAATFGARSCAGALTL